MIGDITDYLFNRIDFIQHWGKEKLENMLVWYAANGLLFAVKDKEGKVVASAAVRIVDSNDEYADSEQYNHDPYGDTYFIQLMASDDPKAKKTLTEMIVNKFGKKSLVAYKRFKHDDRKTVLPAMRFKTIHQMG